MPPKIPLTRRNFLGSLAAGLVATAIPAPTHTLKIGIGTYSYHNLTMDEMIVQLKALKIQEIEMSRGEFMLMNHPADDLFKQAREKFERAGIRCVSYYAATLKETSDLESAIRFAKILNANNVTGDATGGILQQIDRRFTQEHLTFGIHNHFFKGEKFAYESPEDVLNALQGLSATVGATADVGHFASCGHDPVDAIRKLGPRLKLVHLKDIQAPDGEVNVLLGTGISKIAAVMKELRQQKFAGLIAVEYEKEGNVNEDMRREVEFARSLAR